MDEHLNIKLTSTLKQKEPHLLLQNSKLSVEKWEQVQTKTFTI